MNARAGLSTNRASGFVGPTWRRVGPTWRRVGPTGSRGGWTGSCMDPTDLRVGSTRARVGSTGRRGDFTGRVRSTWPRDGLTGSTLLGSAAVKVWPAPPRIEVWPGLDVSGATARFDGGLAATCRELSRLPAAGEANAGPAKTAPKTMRTVRASGS